MKVPPDPKRGKDRIKSLSVEPLWQAADYRLLAAGLRFFVNYRSIPDYIHAAAPRASMPFKVAGMSSDGITPRTVPAAGSAGAD